MKYRVLPALVCMVVFLCVLPVMADGEPVLPKGLFQVDEKDRADLQPELPQGLGSLNQPNPNDVPELPVGLDFSSPKEETDSPSFSPDSMSIPITGFWEVRSGYRLQNDKYEKDASIGEARLQLEMEKAVDGFVFKFTSDLYYDWVLESHSVDLESGSGFLDLREASVSYTPFDFMDVKLGRQILTWGTGDLVFINDLFPKDWQSFFIGRDTEYLKAPSDAVKASFFSDIANVNLVYTPRFDSDRYITGQRLSYWDGTGISGADLHTDKPDDWFGDDELAMRVSKNISGYELAAYGYWGYWKSPAGFDTTLLKYTFPKLNVYGASARGQVGRGIGNVEIGYYDSRGDTAGDDAYVDNSQMRYLVGYEQDLPEVANDLTLGLQYYVEQMIDYDEYVSTLPVGSKSDEEYRHLLTFRVTKLYMNQNLSCSVFTYFSPSDKDVYMRPNVNYKVNDNLMIEMGGNVFWGDYQHTFFGQFDDNTNIYTAIRYTF